MPEHGKHSVRTMCPMNCHPTLCGMIATVEDNKLVDIRGDKDNPDSRGFLCVRGQAAREIMDNPQRLLYPMVRDNRNTDDWERVSWDEALTRITDKIRSVRADSVAIWPGHGSLANDYGTFANVSLALRLASMYGMQLWDPSMICWGLGGLGLGLTGIMEINSKEDMGEHADLIILWGANLASQPNTARHVTAAKSRGARLIAIDVRKTEACKIADESFIVKPGTDAALALAMMQVIVSEDLHDRAFIDEHTIGFDRLQAHVRKLTPEWAGAITGISANRVAGLARTYAGTERAMIVIGGSSLYKDRHGWQASRAVSCLPALTGKSGKPGTGLGPRHAGSCHGFQLGDIVNFAARPAGDYIPNQMSAIGDAIESGRIRALLLVGTNFLSSFSDANRVAKGLEKMDLVVHHDLFMTDTARRHADVVLPATSWLEDTGVKGTATHFYLMDQALEPAGETRSVARLMRDLATRLEIGDFYPWDGEHGHIDAVMDVDASGHATVESLRQQGGILELDVSHVAHVDHHYTTPSGKIEFYSETAENAGLPALPVYDEKPVDDYPLVLRFGRTLTHFHAFYDHGRALPSLAKQELSAVLWISPGDAQQRQLEDGASIRIHNDRGEMQARARVTDDVPPGTVWMHDGYSGLNTLTSGSESVPDSATALFPFSVGQAAYDARVEVSIAI